MRYQDKTREELILELIELRKQLLEHEIEQKEEERFDDNLKRYKIFSDNASDLVYFCDTKGNILYVNRIFEKLTGYKPEDFAGKPFAKLFDETNLKKGMDAYAKTLEGESPEYEVIFRDTGVMCEYKNFPFRNKEGKIIGVVGIARDVTDRRKREEELEEYRRYLEDLAEKRLAEKEALQAQLHHSQKMAAIGRLAGGIAHDFNNILTAIKNFSYVGIKRTSGTDYETSKIFEQIQSVSVSAINLTRQLLTFSQKEFTNICDVDVNKVINELLEMLNHLMSEDVTILTDLDADLWTIRGDIGKLEQVITNLIVNSRDAMPEGGIITVRSKNIAIDKAALVKIPYARTGRFVRLTIEDTGVGIPPENLDHIFEPFFTTKKTASHSGLGLPVIYGIIKDHEGWINVCSSLETGASFNIYLPAVDTC